MDIQLKIKSIRRLLNDIESISKSNERIVLSEIQLNPSDKVYAIIKEYQPIKRREITRKAYYLNGDEITAILNQLYAENKIDMCKAGKTTEYSLPIDIT